MSGEAGKPRGVYRGAAVAVALTWVLRAIGLSTRQADSSIRFSFGRNTVAQDVKQAIELIDTTLTSALKLAAHVPKQEQTAVTSYLKQHYPKVLHLVRPMASHKLGQPSPAKTRE